MRMLSCVPQVKRGECKPTPGKLPAPWEQHTWLELASNFHEGTGQWPTVAYQEARGARCESGARPTALFRLARPQSDGSRSCNHLSIKHGHVPIKHGNFPSKHGRFPRQAAPARHVRSSAAADLLAIPRLRRGNRRCNVAPNCNTLLLNRYTATGGRKGGLKWRQTSGRRSIAHAG